MKRKRAPHEPTKRLSKDEQTDRVAREIIRSEKSARDEKTQRLRAARLKRDAGEPDAK